jgi:hypothetical protein
VLPSSEAPFIHSNGDLPAERLGLCLGVRVSLLMLCCIWQFGNPASAQEVEVAEVEIVGMVASQDSVEVEVVGLLEPIDVDGVGEVEVVATVESVDSMVTGQVEVLGTVISDMEPVEVEVVGRLLPTTVLTPVSWGTVKKGHVERR